MILGLNYFELSSEEVQSIEMIAGVKKPALEQDRSFTLL